MKKRSINGNHINMIKGRLGGEGIDSDAALWLAVSTSNMLMNRAAAAVHVRRGGGTRAKAGAAPAVGASDCFLKMRTIGGFFFFWESEVDPIRRKPGRER